MSISAEYRSLRFESKKTVPPMMFITSTCTIGLSDVIYSIPLLGLGKTWISFSTCATAVTEVGSALQTVDERTGVDEFGVVNFPYPI
jgi:hypothetical protein